MVVGQRTLQRRQVESPAPSASKWTRSRNGCRACRDRRVRAFEPIVSIDTLALTIRDPCRRNAMKQNPPANNVCDETRDALDIYVHCAGPRSMKSWDRAARVPNRLHSEHGV